MSKPKLQLTRALAGLLCCCMPAQAAPMSASKSIGGASAATAAAWAGAAPGPNMCWYYTDASRTQGFWDVCQLPIT
jgi:hypothetical protein